MYYNDYNRLNEQPEEPMVIPTPAPDSPGPAPRKKRTGLKITALCLVCALLGGLAGGAAVRFIPGLGENTVLYEGHAPVAVTMSSVTSDQPMTGAQVYAANVGSSVGITTELVTTNFWGQTVRGAAAGSGFVVTHDGYILTNYHVIDGASSIRVAFADGTSYPATLVGGEEPNDIAVLKIEAEGLTPVVLGDSDNLVVGEQVCAIGNPLGELTFTFTSGYVSAKDRSITMESGEVMNMLQTDTAINSGNSGGPLFNMYGQVIGITTAKYSSSSSSSASVEGIGFAIPINDVKDMVKDIIEKGYVSGKPNVGIIMNDVPADAQRYGIPAGASVAAVLEGACGDKAGLQVGDIITAVGDTPVTSSKQLSSLVKEYKAGDTVSFTVYRDGQNQTLSITLDENDTERAQAVEELYRSYQESQQQAQQQQPQQGYSWPFGGLFGW
jgi:serine protease Do